MKDIDARGFKTPFNSPRDPALPPYHLRNGIKDRAEADRNEAEHRRRLGMTPPDDRARFEAWFHAAEDRHEFVLTGDTHYTKLPDGRYKSVIVEACWRAWQAAQR